MFETAKVDNSPIAALLQKYGIDSADGSSFMINNRDKIVLYFVMERGLSRYCVKLARHPEHNRFIEHEYDNLSKLHTLISGNEILENSIPKPISLGYDNDRAYAVTDFFNGRKLFSAAFKPKQYEQIVSWLTELHWLTRKENGFDRDILMRYINHRLEPVMALDDMPKDLRLLFDGIMDGWDRMGRKSIPAAFTHNDFTSANILFNNNDLYVVDWSWATEAGFLFIDLLDVLLYSVYKGTDDYISALKILSSGSTVRHGKIINGLIKRYKDRFDLPDELARWLTEVFLFGKAAQFHRAGRMNRFRLLADCCNYVHGLGASELFSQ